MRQDDTFKAKEQKMKKLMFIAFLVTSLAACVPTQPNETDVFNTAIAKAQTSIPLTQAALPTATPPPPTDTPTATVVVILSTPPPTQPPVPILTPDAIQVERWKEYQMELAKVFFSFDPDHPEGYNPEAYKIAMCEWDILGQSGQEVYIWADCISGLDLRRHPAVIYLELDGTIRKVNIQRFKVNYPVSTLTYDLHLFPIDVQEKLCLYYFFGIVPQCNDIVPNYVPHLGPFEYPPSRESVLILHLEYRKDHADELPLIVLSATPAASPTP
jgi:hypothetical protein